MKHGWNNWNIICKWTFGCWRACWHVGSIWGQAQINSFIRNCPLTLCLLSTLGRRPHLETHMQHPTLHAMATRQAQATPEQPCANQRYISGSLLCNVQCGHFYRATWLEYGALWRQYGIKCRSVVCVCVSVCNPADAKIRNVEMLKSNVTLIYT